MIQTILRLVLQESARQFVVQQVRPASAGKGRIGSQSASPTECPAGPAVFIDRSRPGGPPERFRPARALVDTLQTDEFEHLQGPNVEHALAAVPVAGEHHRVPFRDIQYAVVGQPGFDFQRVPMQFSLRGVNVCGGTQKHQAEEQERTSVDCKQLHFCAKVSSRCSLNGHRKVRRSRRRRDVPRRAQLHARPRPRASAQTRKGYDD